MAAVASALITPEAVRFLSRPKPSPCRAMPMSRKTKICTASSDHRASRVTSAPMSAAKKNEWVPMRWPPKRKFSMSLSTSVTLP